MAFFPFTLSNVSAQLYQIYEYGLKGTKDHKIEDEAKKANDTALLSLIYRIQSDRKLLYLFTAAHAAAAATGLYSDNSIVIIAYIITVSAHLNTALNLCTDTVTLMNILEQKK